MKLIILDEADALLRSNFKHQIYDILSILPKCQIVLCSATFPRYVYNLANSFMSNPKQIKLSKNKFVPSEIMHFYVEFDDDAYKFEALVDIFQQFFISQTIIFCSSSERAEWVYENLKNNNFPVLILTGKMDQKERDSVFNLFKEGEIKILVTTDVWSRGIDIKQVSIVINYDLAGTKETYIHRAGRVGRFGKKGASINFILSEELEFLKQIERDYNIKITELPNNLEDLL